MAILVRRETHLKMHNLNVIFDEETNDTLSNDEETNDTLSQCFSKNLALDVKDRISSSDDILTRKNQDIKKLFENDNKKVCYYDKIGDEMYDFPCTEEEKTDKTDSPGSKTSTNFT